MTNTPSLPLEPLVLSAPLAERMAAAHCRTAPAGHDCGWYHAFWQYMRLMGMGKTLSGQSDRFLRTVREWTLRQDLPERESAPAVLISGCADYSVLAHVLAGCEGMVRRPEITALDVCETPLWLNRWYAGRLGAPVTTECADILEHRAVARYDLVLTSSFLGYFSAEVRPRMFAQYAAMLRPGGWLVFTSRLRGGSESVPIGFTADQVLRFAEQAALLSADLPEGAGLSALRAHEMASAYGARFQSFPVNSVGSIESLARGAGLRPVVLDTVSSPAPRPALSGPTLADGADYVFAVLEK